MNTENPNYQDAVFKKLRLQFSSSIMEVILTLFSYGGNTFLLYMTYRFAKSEKNAKTNDPILGKKVPTIVFLQNQRLIKRIMK